VRSSCPALHEIVLSDPRCLVVPALLTLEILPRQQILFRESFWNGIGILGWILLDHFDDFFGRRDGKSLYDDLAFHLDRVPDDFPRLIDKIISIIMKPETLDIDFADLFDIEWSVGGQPDRRFALVLLGALVRYPCVVYESVAFSAVDFAFLAGYFNGADCGKHH